jgi:hypothetical protein
MMRMLLTMMLLCEVQAADCLVALRLYGADVQGSSNDFMQQRLHAHKG